jgi:uncharacterized protein (TIGR02444 family)
LAEDPTDIWPWAVAAYARPGVAEACLRLQDEQAQNVCLLLWAAWSGADADALARGAVLARRWEGEVVGPLRQARRALKPAAPGIDAVSREALRAQVKAAELAAERVLLEALATIARRRTVAGATKPALKAAVQAWGRPASATALAALAAALG